MKPLPHKLKRKLNARQTNDSYRVLPEYSGDVVDMASNDYLGFAASREIAEKAQSFILENSKNGATGSRLISGNHQLLHQLENQLASQFNSEAALVFNSGYDANIGFFSSVPQRGDIILYDEFIHASIRDGIQLSNAKSYNFKHNSLANVAEKLNKLGADFSEQNHVYIVTESVFSMDGDSPDLKQFALFCEENTCNLVVDEAHALGVFGPYGTGLCEELAISSQVFARIFTFGKGLGCHGAAVLGSVDLKNYLINFARSFIYTTALPPHAVAVILAALTYLKSLKGQKAMALLKKNSTIFKEECIKLKIADCFISSNSAIYALQVPGNKQVKKIANVVITQGFLVKAIVAPTVPEGQERLRFCLHSFNTQQEISRVLEVVKNNLK